MDRDLVKGAAEVIASADALFVGAGAGMGVDSGLPDFRGAEGFWRAYPPYQKLGLHFYELANPRWFVTDPELAWGFYGHRLNLYRNTSPHAGFGLLRSWAGRMPHGAWVFTSNVDGHFQRSGVDPQRIVEVHGSIHHVQCTAGCGAGVLPADGVIVDIDLETMRARPPLPACPSCGALARPNILMFGDWHWDSQRATEQEARMQQWLRAVTGARVAVIELGAGKAVPTVRRTCEALSAMTGGRLIRINRHEPEVPAGHIGLQAGALEALHAMDAWLESSRT